MGELCADISIKSAAEHTENEEFRKFELPTTLDIDSGVPRTEYLLPTQTTTPSADVCVYHHPPPPTSTNIDEVVHDLQLGAVDIDSVDIVFIVRGRLVHEPVDFPIEVGAAGGEEVHAALYVVLRCVFECAVVYEEKIVDYSLTALRMVDIFTYDGRTLTSVELPKRSGDDLSLVFPAMLLDAHHDERPGIRIDYSMEKEERFCEEEMVFGADSQNEEAVIVAASETISTQNSLFGSLVCPDANITVTNDNQFVSLRYSRKVEVKLFLWVAAAEGDVAGNQLLQLTLFGASDLAKASDGQLVVRKFLSDQHYVPWLVQKELEIFEIGAVRFGLLSFVDVNHSDLS
ncbi:unnamed protein product [Schistocephalus solidus]|uniref:PITH domain-containing protein n=1 Tax=Schistocephalus solidus TaxID=70667 RepID=A0A183SNH1_SCHSO|nr:unnamed protein product [Schistocephalus solidus]